MSGPDGPGRPVRVPSGRIARLAGFGGMTSGIAGRALVEGARRIGRGERVELRDLMLTPANVLRVTDELARMRGAAMKLGQLISMDAGDVLPAELAELMARLRAEADFMPPRQLKAVLGRAWGADWLSRFARFDVRPIAAASIGQVHRARTKDGRDVALKVQYPGIARSIDSDIDNVVALFRVSGLAPPGLDLAPLVDEAKRQLREESDYAREARNLERFGALLGPRDGFAVPEVVGDLTTDEVLTMGYLPGRPIETMADAAQEVRDDIVTRLLRLTLREIFEFRLMQTDPNLANFCYDPRTGRIGLLDFGATRSFADTTVEAYRRLLVAGLGGERGAIRDCAVEIGFFSNETASRHQDMVVGMISLVFEGIERARLFDFRDNDLLDRMRSSGMLLAADREFVEIPPIDVLHIQRKIAGIYMIGRRLGARVPVRDLLTAHAGGAATPVGRGDGADAD